MLKLFNKKLLLLSILLLNTTYFPLSGDECCSTDCNDNGCYFGAFGGELFSKPTQFTQTGTAFFLDSAGGPLAVNAKGHSKKYSSGYAGVQLGYEWKGYDCSGWNAISCAAEVEAFFYKHTHKAHLINPTDRLPEHDFSNIFPTYTGIYLVNGVFALTDKWFFRNFFPCLEDFVPYIGIGCGAANIRIRKATSTQVSPPEAANHFNSRRSDGTWAFAAQGKTGLRYRVYGDLSIFGEYRFLYVDSSRFKFGSTIYPDHVATSPWNIDMKSTIYNAYTLGVRFDL